MYVQLLEKGLSKKESEDLMKNVWSNLETMLKSDDASAGDIFSKLHRRLMDVCNVGSPDEVSI